MVVILPTDDAPSLTPAPATLGTGLVTARSPAPVNMASASRGRRAQGPAANVTQATMELTVMLSALVTRLTETAVKASLVMVTAMPAGRATTGGTVTACVRARVVCVTLVLEERGPVWSANRATLAATVRHSALA